MKPIRSFFYLFIILAGFLLVSRFLIDPIKNEQFSKQDSIPGFVSDSALIIAPDIFADSISVFSSVQASKPIKTTDEAPICYPSGDSTALNSFFDKMVAAQSSTEPARILYFGDSQLEGDRVTGAIRSRFQEVFGGGGSGFLTPDLLYSTSRSVNIERSDNWSYLTLKDFNGAQENNSILFHSASLEAGEKGWFKLKHLGGKSAAQRFSVMKVFYQATDSLSLEVKQDQKTVYSGKLPGHPSIRALNFKFTDNPTSVEFIFQSKETLQLTAFSLENQNGIQVDNIALRGQVAPPLSRSNMQSLRETIRLINPSLCIWQFGVNLVPYPRDNYDYYRELLINEIWLLKQLMPDVPVLLVGLSDMAKKENGKMISYPNIQAIKKAQLEAAQLCHCVYWDLEAFMGGPGSMIKWVESDPRLGQKDYIHFTEKGAQYVGEHLADLLLNEYQYYQKTKDTE